MYFLIKYLTVFLQINILVIFIYSSGLLFKNLFFENDKSETIENNIIWGFILLSFISLLINFFLPLSQLINSLIFLIIITISIQKNFFKNLKVKFIKNIFFITLLSFIILIHSNVNMPDALLYHLPYSKILNEHKILIGISNIHHRFAHISIFQYINSMFYLPFVGEKGLLIPSSILASSFFLYLFKEFKILFKSNQLRINSFLIFLILITSIYSFNRYSNYGNDAPAHIYFFFSIIYFLKYNFDHKNDVLLKKITLISLFVFFIKPFYIVLLLIPLVLLISNKNYKNFFYTPFFLFLSFYSFLWVLKNLLISSCIIYPVKQTCLKFLSWSNLEEIKNQSLLGEVMSKSWQNRLDKKISMIDYNQNFEWLYTWSTNHLNVVLEKFLPLLFILIFFSIFSSVKSLLKKKKLIDENRVIKYAILIISLIGSLIWLVKFPIYRYGQSYLYIFVLFVFYLLIFQKLDKDKLFNYKKFLNLIILIFFFSGISKNFVRIYQKIEDPILPNMYDNIQKSSISKKFLNKEGKFTHFIKEDASLCGYSISPCSENKNSSIDVKNIMGYNIYFISKYLK